MKQTAQKIIYTIYEFTSVASICTLPNGEEVHFRYVGCTMLDPVQRAKALERNSKRISTAVAQLAAAGLSTGFVFKVLAQTDDPVKAEKLETKYINNGEASFSLNTVRDSFYASVVATVKDALVDISIAPNHRGGVATFRVNRSLVKIQYCSFDGEDKPSNRKPTLKQVFQELGINPISKSTYDRMAGKNQAKWKTLATLVSPEGDAINAESKETVSK